MSVAMPCFGQSNRFDFTCLKWSADGALSPVDAAQVLRRLCAVDPAMRASGLCELPQCALPQSPFGDNSDDG